MPSTIRKGDRGSDVKLLQERLSVHGYPTSPDGIFGSGTQAKVMQFQKSHGMASDGIVGPKTWDALAKDPKGVSVEPPGPLPPILVHLQSLGHKIVWEGDFHLNLFGIRNPNPIANSFDDILGCAYTEKGLWRVHIWPGTTDPGTYWLENPSRVEGTAMLKEGQYLDVWKIDLHQGKYEALCQRNGDVQVYRDKTKDNKLDKGKVYTGTFGINIHRSSTSGESTQVNKWSAGCQVHARLDGFNEMMALARKQVEVLGIETFSYSLMDQWW
jgi:hypothetical protein